MTGFIAIGVAVYLWHNVKHIGLMSAIVGSVLSIIGLGLTVYGLVSRRHEAAASSHIINQSVSDSTVYGSVTQIADGNAWKRRDG